MNLGAIFGGAAPMALGAGFGQAVDIWSGREAAKDQRAWSADMSNTAYQRAVADMRAAGLNPMLAYQLGGASTPSTSVAETGSFPASFSSAVQAKRVNKEVQLLDEQIEKTREETGTARFARMTASQMYDVLLRTFPDVVAKVKAESASSVSTAKLLSTSIPEAEQNKKFWESMAGEPAKWIQMIRSVLPSVRVPYQPK